MPSTKNKTNRLRKARREGVLAPHADDRSVRKKLSGVMEERREDLPAALPTPAPRRPAPLSTKRKTKRHTKAATTSRRTTPTTQRGARGTVSRGRGGAGSKRLGRTTRR